MGVGIQVEKLNAYFGKTQALHDINISIAANHCTAVIGPSGTADYAVSASGVLAYFASAGSNGTTLAWADRTGQTKVSG